MSESSHSPTNEILLDAYESERKEPRETCEQEQLYEFEGFVVLEHLQLLCDQIEQQENIGAEERRQQAREKQRSEQLVQLEHCYRIFFCSF